MTKISKFTVINLSLKITFVSIISVRMATIGNKSVWYWGDVKDAPSNWPDGVNFQPNGKYGAYLDIPLTEVAKSIGFLLLDESKTEMM